jgi:hypothetical protein
MLSEAMFIVCGKCGKASPSGLRADMATTIAEAKLSNSVIACRCCRYANLWSEAELWPESVVIAKKLEVCS